MSFHSFSVDDWTVYFHDIGLRPDVIAKYMVHIKDCYSRKIPPIFEVDHLALLLGVPVQEVYAMSFGTSSFYRTFKIKKRSGGSRTIAAPLPSLLGAQRWIYENILTQVKVSICATGFRPKKSILTNAHLHCNREQLLKIDIKDFFPSINFRRVMHLFRDLGYPMNVSFILARLCTLDDALPQGSAASPAIANAICRRLDLRIYRLARQQKLRYTRYADDIVISGSEIQTGVRRLIFEVIEDEGFTVNTEKVRFIDDGEKKIITGLDISTGTPRVTREFRRKLKQDIYFVWSAGLSAHLSRRRIFAPTYLDHLQGRLQFWTSIEPSCRQMLLCRARLEQVFEAHGRQLGKTRQKPIRVPGRPF